MTKFNLEEELTKLEKDYPRMFLAGLKSHIERNKIAIKSKKELDKIVDEFGKIKI